MAQGINANLARRCVQEAEKRGHGSRVGQPRAPEPLSNAAPAAFVLMTVPTPQTTADIRIEFSLCTTTAVMSWPT